MLKGQLISMADGNIHPFAIQKSYGTGAMTATNSVTGEAFSGQYTGTYQGGGSSFGTVYNPQSATYANVQMHRRPTDATARGYLRGDKGTVIEIFMDIEPGIRPKGNGTGTDNHGNRYQIQF